MSNKNDWKESLNQLVFSTHNEESDQFVDTKEEHKDDQLVKKGQKVRIWLDRKKRRGKAVSLICGLEENDDDLKHLATKIKKLCGVGGSIKDGEILIQGDHRKKILELLIKEGYTNTRLSGG